MSVYLHISNACFIHYGWCFDSDFSYKSETRSSRLFFRRDVVVLNCHSLYSVKFVCKIRCRALAHSPMRNWMNCIVTYVLTP